MNFSSKMGFMRFEHVPGGTVVSTKINVCTLHTIDDNISEFHPPKASGLGGVRSQSWKSPALLYKYRWWFVPHHGSQYFGWQYFLWHCFKFGWQKIFIVQKVLCHPSSVLSYWSEPKFVTPVLCWITEVNLTWSLQFCPELQKWTYHCKPNSVLSYWSEPNIVTPVLSWTIEVKLNLSTQFCAELLTWT